MFPLKLHPVVDNLRNISTCLWSMISTVLLTHGAPHAYLCTCLVNLSCLCLLSPSFIRKCSRHHLSVSPNIKSSITTHSLIGWWHMYVQYITLEQNQCSFIMWWRWGLLEPSQVHQPPWAEAALRLTPQLLNLKETWIHAAESDPTKCRLEMQM
jgi:hypothetical protein